MTARWTLERTLHKPDPDPDRMGVRAWRIHKDGDRVQIARSEYSDGIDITVADVPRLIADLQDIAGAST